MIKSLYFCFKARRKWGVHHPLTDLRPALGERLHVFHIQRIQCLADAGGEAVLFQKVSERLGGGGKTAGHANMHV